MVILNINKFTNTKVLYAMKLE